MQPKEDIFRAASPFSDATAQDEFGLLRNLPGLWSGKGFNLIARPARQGDTTKPPFILEVNGTRETLEFTMIGGDIPNRGDIEKTVLLHGIHYLQTVHDCEDNSAIHKEPGVWLHVPETKESSSETYVRLASIPHGDSLLAQSTFFGKFAGGPTIKPVDAFPFPIANAIPPLDDVAHSVLGASYVTPYLSTPLPTDCLPEGLDAKKTIRDPTEVLRAQIAKQGITETRVIQISTSPPGNILNIPFVVKNANAVQMDAIFWIEKVKRPTDPPGGEFLQLQYVQRVILDFDNVHWPHISVATLVKSG